MYDLYGHCVFNLNPRACSIDTPLHTFVPFKHVDHLHPNAVIAIAACVDQERLCREVYGDEVIYVPWQRPGLRHRASDRGPDPGQPEGEGGAAGPPRDELLERRRQDLLRDGARDHRPGRRLHRGARPRRAHVRRPEARGPGRRRAAPPDRRDRSRGCAGASRPTGASWAPSRTTRRCCASSTAWTGRGWPSWAPPAPTTSCAPRSSRCSWTGIPRRRDLGRAARRARRGPRAVPARTTRPTTSAAGGPTRPPMRDPNPTVVLIPGLGMIAWGKSKSESRVTAEFYNCAIEVMRGAEAIDRYEAMDQQEAFDIEYWSLEEAKLRRLPPEKELDRQIVVVVGAGAGIGKATAHRAGEGRRPRRVRRPRRRRPPRRRRARSSPRTARASAWPARASATAARRSASPATSPTARASPRCSSDGAAGLRRASTRSSSRPGSSCRPTASGRIDDRQWALTFGVNVTGRLHRGRRGQQDLQVAGAAGEHRAHHQRQRGGGEEGQPGLRHQQGGGEPPGARAGGRDGAARPRQRAWRRPRSSRAARCSRASA